MLKHLLRRLVVPPLYQAPPLQNPWKDLLTKVK